MSLLKIALINGPIRTRKLHPLHNPIILQRNTIPFGKINQLLFTFQWHHTSPLSCLYPGRTSTFSVGWGIGRYVWTSVWLLIGHTEVQGREFPCKERTERWEADANYADIDFDYGPKTGLYVVFWEALAKVGNKMLRGGMLEEEHLQVVSGLFAAFSAKNRMMLVNVTL